MTIASRRSGVGPLRADGVAADERSYEDLFEYAPCGYLSTLADGTIVRVNQTFLTMTGYSLDQVIGHNFATFLSVGGALFYETRCLPVLRLEGELQEVALVLSCFDGALLSTVVNCALRASSEDEPPLIYTAVFDSTRRRDYERDLLEARRAAELSESRLRVLEEAATTFGSSESEDSLTAALAETARGAFDATCTAVMLVDDGRARLVAGTDPLDASDDLDSAARPQAEALRSGSVVTIGNLEEAHRAFPAIVEPLVAARLEAMTVVPLPGADSAPPLGLLVCFFGRRREFDDHAMEVQTALTRYAAQVLRRIRLQSELEKMAMHDQLTGLANRELLRRRLHEALRSAELQQRPMALLILDLDGFKAVNDHLGHLFGDSVLEQVADRLRHAVRRRDTIARFGGDEFVVVCEDTDGEAAARIAERIREAIEKPLTGAVGTLPISVSIGVALHTPTRGVTAMADVMMRQADAAMYTSKRNGRNRTTVVEV